MPKLTVEPYWQTTDRRSLRVYSGDVLRTLRCLPRDHFHCVVTSPPYFALRSYLKADDPLKPLEIGSEKTPEEFIDVMVKVFAGVRRVMHPSGLLFLNLGDSYNSIAGNYRGLEQGMKRSETTSTLTGGLGRLQNKSYRYKADRKPDKKLGDGQLLNMPHRVAEALRADGWHWRQTIVWAKPCLSGGTWLYARTQKGDAPAMLKDLVRLNPSTVQLWNGEKWTRVVGWREVKAPLGSRRVVDRGGHLELVLRSGERIGCTAEHRWPTERGEVDAKDLKVGDVLLQRKLPEPDSPSPLCFSDESIAWVCGFYLAEGNKTDKGLIFSVHSSETGAFERIKSLAVSLGGTAQFNPHRGKSAAIVVFSTPLRELVGEFISGRTSHNKRLDRKAWMRNDGFLRAILAGYLQGDGHRRDATDEWRLGFCNNDGLATDLRTLGARLGYSVRLKRAQHQCNGKRFPGWRGSLRNGGDRKKPDTQIAAIEHSRARVFWDIEVEDAPNLFCLASGVLSHNSPMPESVKGWRWERCRVKVKGNAPTEQQGTYQSDSGNRTLVGFNERCANESKRAQYISCPGCPKCIPHGGYVLRKGRGRCTTAHEYIFVMAKSARYFWDSAAFVEESRYPNDKRRPMGSEGAWQIDGRKKGENGGGKPYDHDTSTRNPRSVWTISAEPTDVAHFASYPTELVRRCLKAGTSNGGCCSECGEPYAPVVEDRQLTRERPNDRTSRHNAGGGVNSCGNTVAGVDTRILGYRATCGCDSPSVPCRVLDPFLGTGRTLRACVEMRREGWGIDINRVYLDNAVEMLKGELLDRPALARLIPGREIQRRQVEML